MRAPILESVHGAILVTPQHEVFRQAGEADRGACDGPARQYRVPEVQQPTAHTILDGFSINHCLSSKLRARPARAAQHKASLPNWRNVSSKFRSVQASPSGVRTPSRLSAAT